MYNKIVLVGHLTRDVELRYLPNGNAVATIGVATNRRYKKQDGSQADDTCFVDAQAFGRTAEVINQYLRKGSKVLIEGKLCFQQWTDQMGQKRSKHFVAIESMQMMDSKQETANNQQSAYQQQTYQQQTPQNQQGQYPNVDTQQSGYEAQQQVGQQTTANPQEGMPQQGYNIPELSIDDEDIPF